MKKVNIITLMVLIVFVSILLLSGCTSIKNDLQTSDSGTSSLSESRSPSFEPSSPVSEPPASSSTPPSSSSEPPTSSVQPSAPPVESSVPPASSSAPPTQSEVDADASTVTIVLRVTTVKISDLPLSVPYTIHSKSSKEITVEPQYEIERYDGANWVSFPFNADDPPNWPEGNTQLESDTSMDDSLSIWDFAEEITPGTYRVVKEIAEADKPPVKLYAEFVVVE